MTAEAEMTAEAGEETEETTGREKIQDYERYC